jgi:hypothetical protein
MLVNYKVTVSDYRNAVALHYRLRGRWRSPLNIFFFMPIVGALLLINDVVDAFRRDNYFSGGNYFVVLVPLSMLALPLLYRYLTKKQFKNMFPHSRTDSSLTIDIDDQRIVSEMAGFSESKILWNAIVKFAQNEKVTLFYLAESRFLFVPTNAFSAAQRTELNDLVARHGVKRLLC